MHAKRILQTAPHKDAMQQYQYSNFSDVFCLNCIFVFDDAVKQLVCGSFLKYGASAVTMAAHKIIKKKSNFHCTRFIKLTVVLERGSEWRSRPRGLAPGQRSCEETSQRWQAFGYSESDLIGLGIEPQTFHINSDIFNTGYIRPVC